MSENTKYEVRRGGRWVEVDRATWLGWNGVSRATRITGKQALPGRAAAAKARQQLKKRKELAGNWVLSTHPSPDAAPPDPDVDEGEKPDD